MNTLSVKNKCKTEEKYCVLIDPTFSIKHLEFDFIVISCGVSFDIGLIIELCNFGGGSCDKLIVIRKPESGYY